MQNLEKPFTFSECQYLYEHFNLDGAEDCAEKLGRTVRDVQYEADRLDLIPSGEFTEQELKTVKAYMKCLRGALVFILPKRTPLEIEEMVKCVST